MLIPLRDLRDVYRMIRDQARFERTAVLIFVSGECDSIAAAHIFTSFLRSDHITFTLNPVQNYDDVAGLLQKRDPSTYKSVILINCGACINLEDRLGLADEQWNDSKIFVFDSHRPIHFNNLYFDRRPITTESGEHIFEDSIEYAKVVIVNDNENVDDDLPTFEDALLHDEEYDDFEAEAPAHRRRIGDADESTAAVDEETRQEELSNRRMKQISNLKIEKDLGKDTNELLWWGILGLTEQYLDYHIGKTEYEIKLRSVVEDVARLNPEDPRGGSGMSRITLVSDFKFILLRYWTLYESMYYSDYTATKLQLWKDRKNESNALRTLLAKMGIPRTEAEQKFQSMKSSFQGELFSKLESWSESFQIPEFQFDTFHKIRHLAPCISAADCVHVAAAFLNGPQASSEWSDAFYRAYDVLQWCSSRETLWDEAVAGQSSAIQQAIDIQKVAVEKVFEIQSTKPPLIGNIGVHMGGFRYLRLQVDDSNSVLAQPGTLRKIGHLLAQNNVKSRKSGVYRLLIGAENAAANECTVVGVESPCTSGFQSPNVFGKLFELALQDHEGVEIVHEWFESNCLRIARCSFSNFVSMVNGAADRLYEHDEILNRLIEEDDEPDLEEVQEQEVPHEGQDAEPSVLQADGQEQAAE